MRAIKFKMYCGSVMYSHDDCLTNDFDPRTTTTIDGEKCHWLEFIGRLDKNEKEIYDGHILTNGERIRHIEYDNGFATFCLCTRLKHPIYTINDFENFEIIGDVFQNKNLPES